MEAIKEIRIDNILPFITCPNYCRNNADRIRWLAFKLGFVDIIRPTDEVIYDEQTESYKLMVKGD